MTQPSQRCQRSRSPRNNPPAAGPVNESTAQPTLDVPFPATDPDNDALIVTCAAPLELDVQVTNDGPSAGSDVDRFTLHVAFNGFIGTVSFACDVSDPFNATTQSIVTLTRT